MGDRCYMQVYCRPEDEPVFEEIGFAREYERDEDNITDGILRLVDEEANYGHYDEMPRDKAYYGDSGVGGAYDAGEFACDGETYQEVVVSEYCGGYCVGFDENGEPLQTDIDRVKAFFFLRKKVEAMLKGGES